MLLAVDIGNTNINIGIFKDSRLLKRLSLPTNKPKKEVYFKKLFKQNKIRGIIICSVVPKATIELKNIFKKLSKIELLVVGENLKVPVKNLYRAPSQVGQDRLVNAYAGIMLYGKPLVAIDYGTAVTFDVISKKGEYLGGMILPGLRISLDALNKNTALLPKICLESPSELIGRDTKNSMLSGIVYGFAALTDDLIERISKDIGEDVITIGTGGNIQLLKRYCKKLNFIDQDLTLKGLALIYRDNVCHSEPEGRRI